MPPHAQRQDKDTIIVTGAHGFIGQAVVRDLARQYHVIALDRHIPDRPEPGTTALAADMTSDDSIEKAVADIKKVAGNRLASVVHLAAYHDLSGEDDPKYDTVNIQGTERLFRALQSSFDLEQFIFVSSMLVHAATEKGEPITEDSPLDAKLPYDRSKVRAEELLRVIRKDVPVVFVRPAGVYDDDRGSAFLSHQIARIYEGKLASHVYPGALDTGQPFLHVDDLVDAFARIIERRKSLPSEAAFLLGEADPVSFIDLQNQIGELLYGHPWETWQVPKKLALTGAWLGDEVLDEDYFIKPWMVEMADDHFEIDISRARDQLGWSPQHSLRTTLPRMIGALKDDPTGWYEKNGLNAPQVAGMQSADEEQDQRALQKLKDSLRRDHFKTLWAHFAVIMLGVWLAFTPLLFGLFDQQQVFSDDVWRVTEERGLWDPALRLALSGWNNIASGVLLMLFGALSLSPRMRWARWGTALTGGWLLLASLVFWTPSAGVYANDTLIGTLAIAFALLISNVPGVSRQALADPGDVPPGWNYSPSSWMQRLPIAALALVGFIIARYLAAYQLGHVNSVWEPFFEGGNGRNGTEYIITSDISEAWPVSDAGIGAIAYMLEIMLALMGDSRRWRTMPWMVVAFGIVVVPLGVISIYFLIIQPVLIGTWCTLCLIAALAMVAMIPFALDELLATLQSLVQSLRRGLSFPRAFFRGDIAAEGGRDDLPGFDAPFGRLAGAMARGNTMPWTLVVTALIGLGLMLTRLLFGTEAPMAHSDHMVGALIFTVSVMAMAEVGRPLRFINVLFGLWLVAAPWILGGAALIGTLAVTIAGIAVIALSLPRGKRSQNHYGSWDYYIV